MILEKNFIFIFEWVKISYKSYQHGPSKFITHKIYSGYFLRNVSYNILIITKINLYILSIFYMVGLDNFKSFCRFKVQLRPELYDMKQDKYTMDPG